MKKFLRILTSATLTAAVVLSAVAGNVRVAEAVPAVTDTQIETECQYDDAYLMNEWAAFITGGKWKEKLQEGATVTFYNVKTKESKVYPAYENGSPVFDCIEPVFYLTDYNHMSETHMCDNYRIHKGDKVALVNSDGTYVGGQPTWYDSVNICGDYIVVSINDKKQILKEAEGVLEVVMDNLSINAYVTTTTEGEYYFLRDGNENTIYDKDFKKIEMNLPEGYELYNPKEYAEQDYMTVRKEISRETTPSGYVNIKYEYNIADKSGNLMLKEAVQSKYMGSPFDMYKDYIWDRTNYILYSTTDWKIVWSFDEKKTEIEDKLGEGWSSINVYYDDDYKRISVSLNNEHNEWETIRYSDYNGFSEPFDGDSFDGLQLDDYLFIPDRKILRNLITGEETEIPCELDGDFNDCRLSKILGNIAVYYCIYPEDEPGNYETHVLMNDGSVKRFDDYWLVEEMEGASYNLCAVKEDNAVHWYMNSFDNEILTTTDNSVYFSLWYGSGYFCNTDTSGFVTLYDQYGNTILGEKTKYMGITNRYIEHELGLDGLMYGFESIQDGYTIVCDENGKFGLVSLSIKYTMQGDVEVTVESENADFVAEDMKVDELVEDSDVASIKANLLAELRKDSKNSLDMKIYDITFFGTDGQEIEPDGKVKVTMTLPADWDSSKTVRVYHVLDDNKIENMEAEIIDGKAVFYTDNFSRYAMVLIDNLKLGDINFDGEVNMTDVTLSLKAALNIMKLTDAEIAAADVDGDGQVTLEDVTSMLKYSLKIITEFPKSSRV